MSNQTKSVLLIADLHHIRRLSDVLPDLGTPQVRPAVPNPHMAGFNAGREARMAIGETNICNHD